MRPIDADAFAGFLERAIAECKYEKLTIDECLTVADVFRAVISELTGASCENFKNAPTIELCEERRKGECPFYAS